MFFGSSRHRGDEKKKKFSQLVLVILFLNIYMQNNEPIMVFYGWLAKICLNKRSWVSRYPSRSQYDK